MTEKKIYFPIGKIITAKQLEAYTPQQLQNRSLDDPRYAGFDAHFDWHRYIQVNVKNTVLAASVVKVLDQISQTPEGQQMLRQALATQTWRDQTGQTENRDAHSDHRIEISDAPHKYANRFTLENYVAGFIKKAPGKVVTALQKVELGNFGGFLQKVGIITVGPDVRFFKIKGRDGEYRDITLQDTIVHELGHARDPLSGELGNKLLGNYITYSYPGADRQFLEDQFILCTEMPAIIATNKYMKHYYHAPEISLDYNSRDRSRARLFPFDINPWDGIANMTHDEIILPKTPTKNTPKPHPPANPLPKR
jgi:hypothetical protein